MSFVEKALRKIQESGSGPADGSSRPAAGRRGSAPERSRDGVDESGNAVMSGREAASGHHPKPVSTRIIPVNRTALRAAGLLPPEHQERQIADQYRQIKRPLIDAAMRRGADALPRSQLIMVTSALPGDGKTFTSINLAMSMALEKDISVLLIDADVAKRHISRLFGVEQEHGLLDVIHHDSLELERAILQTDMPGLSILPAGQRDENATELLASQRMEDVAKQLISNDPGRVVVFDSPPLLLTSEARVIAGMVGQVVVVVRADKTPQFAVQQALDQLQEGKSVGFVLNQSLEAVQSYYHGYGEDQIAR